MDPTPKKLIILVLLLSWAITFAFSPIPSKMNDSLYGYTNVTLNYFELRSVDVYEETTQFRLSVGYAYEIVFALILLQTPLSIFGGAWLLRIACKFAFGDAARHSAFGLGLTMKAFVVVLCVIALFYSLYKQYSFIDRIIEKRLLAKKVSDEARLI